MEYFVNIDSLKKRAIRSKSLSVIYQSSQSHFLRFLACRKMVFSTVFTASLISLSAQVQAAVEFNEHVASDSATSVGSIGSGDFNGDGKIDLLYTSFPEKTIVWLENKGIAGFIKHVVSANADHAIHINDIDQDGDLDLVSESMGFLTWYENDGTGSFTEHLRNGDPIGSSAVASGDFDNDGDVDIVSAGELTETISWFANDGSNNFNGGENEIDSIKNVSFIKTADLDADGDLDLIAGGIAAHFGGPTIAWYKNDGSGGFTKQRLPFDDGFFFRGDIADIDGDGDLDVISTPTSSRRVFWAENDGSGNFDALHLVSTSTIGYFGVASADLDGDGDNDVFSTAPSDGQINWFENDGSGSFTEHVVTSALGSPASIGSADVDGDGDLDLLAASFPENKIVWIEQKGSPNVDPVITSADTALIAENSLPVLTVEATDDDGDTLTFSLSGGSDQSKFEIDSETGDLSFIASPDFENPADITADNVYNVQVTVDDNSGGSAIQDIAVTVADVLEPLTISSGGTPPLPGVIFGGFYTFTPIAVDPDGELIIFSIQNQPSWTDFDQDTGTLSGTPTLADAGVYDNIIISATSTGASSIAASNLKSSRLLSAGIVSLPPFRIVVAGINQAPTFSLIGANPVVVCTNAGGQSVSYINAISDGDFETQQLHFIVESNNPSLFGGLLGFGGQPFISVNSGQLSFRGGLNRSGSADVTVRLKDDGGSNQGGNNTSATSTFTITVDPSCDDGAGQLFNPGQLGFDPLAGINNDVTLADLNLDLAIGRVNASLLNIGSVGNVPLGGLDNIGNISLGGITSPNESPEAAIDFGSVTPFAATISNQSATSGSNVVLSVRLGVGQRFVKTDGRCAIDEDNGQATCYLQSVPAGLTQLGFEAKAPKGDIVNASAEFTATNDRDFRDNSAQLRSAVQADSAEAETSSQNSGGGSLGWFSLLMLAGFRKKQ